MRDILAKECREKYWRERSIIQKQEQEDINKAVELSIMLTNKFYESISSEYKGLEWTIPEDLTKGALNRLVKRLKRLDYIVQVTDNVMSINYTISCHY